MHSNNRKKFVRAAKELGEVRAAEEGIQWKFNPPLDSHIGGVWEFVTQIASVLPDDNRICTVLCVVRSILNSRPLRRPERP